MMQHKFHMIAWLLAIWMLCSIASVNAAPQMSQPAAWRTTPTLSNDIRPAYQFQSTSTLAPIVGTTSYTSTAIYTPGSSKPARARKDEWDWDNPDPEEPGVGEVPAVPVGEPLVLLALALLYLCLRQLLSLHKNKDFKLRQSTKMVG